MTIPERMRERLRPSNTLADGHAPAPSEMGVNRASSAGKRLMFSEPEGIANAYFVEDKGRERRYYEDYLRKTLVIRATDTAIRSRQQDLNTVRAMLDLAAARDWHSVAIKGSASFRREAWIEAEARGLPARGHRPTDPDRQEAERRRRERGRATPANLAAPTSAPGANKASPRPVMRQAQANLSADGRSVLAALSEKIDRQMHRLTNEAKADLMAFVAAELMKKERAQGPVVLTAEQKRAAQAPLQPTRRATEPEAPRRSLSR